MPASGRHVEKESGLPIEINSTERAFFSECILAILLRTTFHFMQTLYSVGCHPGLDPGSFSTTQNDLMA